MLLFHWRSNCALNTIDFCCKTEQIAAPILFFAYLVLNQQFIIITNTYCYFIQRRFVYKKKNSEAQNTKCFAYCIQYSLLHSFTYKFFNSDFCLWSCCARNFFYFVSWIHCIPTKICVCFIWCVDCYCFIYKWLCTEQQNTQHLIAVANRTILLHQFE